MKHNEKEMAMRKRLILMSSLVLALALVFAAPLFATGEREAETVEPVTWDPDPNAMWRQFVTPQVYTQATGQRLPSLNEAPDLAERVAAGELPPVEDRVPRDPMVVQPTHEIGAYGGDLNRAWFGYSDEWGPGQFLGERFVTFNEAGELIPNVPKSWEIRDGGNTLIFNLREGMKWSDGAPLTADDVLFYVNDLKFFEPLAGLAPQPWDDLRFGGERIRVQKLDTYTVRIDFAIPAAQQFLVQRATWGPYTMIAPSHYLKPFHPNHTPQSELDRMAADAGVDDWVALFQQRFDDSNGWQRNPELPVVFAWRPVNTGSASTFRLERNPYYWKVDTEGNQLPYIDNVLYQRLDDAEVLNARAVAGELDFQLRHIAFDNYSLLRENEQRGGYRVGRYTSDSVTALALRPNHTVEDPLKRELFDTQEFKIALSHAINREEVNELLFAGLGTPRNPEGYLPGSPFYDEELAYAYSEYDPDRANQLLDEVGMAARDGDGFRLGPDGNRFQITITAMTTTSSDMLEMAKQYWEDVGIRTRIDQVERGLYEEREFSNNYEFSGAWGIGNAIRPDFEAIYFAPVTGRRGNIYSSGPLWGTWYISDGERGVEPPPYAKRLQELYEEIALAGGEIDRLREIMGEMAQIRVDNIQAIGLGPAEIPSFAVISNRIRNVPVNQPNIALYRTEGRTLPQQFTVVE